MQPGCSPLTVPQSPAHWDFAGRVSVIAQVLVQSGKQVRDRRKLVPGWEAGKGQVQAGPFSGLLKKGLPWTERQVGRRNPETRVREVVVSAEN